MGSLLSPGLRGEALLVVTEELTALAMGSGDVPVLATPAVLGVMEQAACNAVAGALAEGATSVGTWAELEHLAPAAVGAEVRATAELTRAEDRRLEFVCEAREGDTLIARARQRRAIVDRRRFLEGSL